MTLTTRGLESRMNHVTAPPSPITPKTAIGEGLMLSISPQNRHKIPITQGPHMVNTDVDRAALSHG